MGTLGEKCIQNILINWDTYDITTLCENDQKTLNNYNARLEKAIEFYRKDRLSKCAYILFKDTILIYVFRERVKDFKLYTFMNFICDEGYFDETVLLFMRDNEKITMLDYIIDHHPKLIREFLVDYNAIEEIPDNMKECVSYSYYLNYAIINIGCYKIEYEIPANPLHSMIYEKLDDEVIYYIEHYKIDIIKKPHNILSCAIKYKRSKIIEYILTNDLYDVNLPSEEYSNALELYFKYFINNKIQKMIESKMIHHDNIGYSQLCLNKLEKRYSDTNIIKLLENEDNDDYSESLKYCIEKGKEELSEIILRNKKVNFDRIYNVMELYENIDKMSNRATIFSLVMIHTKMTLEKIMRFLKKGFSEEAIKCALDRITLYGMNLPNDPLRKQKEELFCRMISSCNQKYFDYLCEKGKMPMVYYEQYKTSLACENAYLRNLISIISNKRNREEEPEEPNDSNKRMRVDE
jgi:hypothetical protein